MNNDSSRIPFLGLLGQSATFISAFNVAQVCLTWYVFTFTRSAIAVGLVGIVESTVMLAVSLPIGTFVDRLNKGMLLAIAGISGFAVFAILSLNILFFSFDLILIMVLVAVWGASREITRSAALSALPEVVTSGTMARANGVYRALGSSTGSISNALAGGLIAALGVISGFLFSAGAYLASAVFAVIIIFPFLKKKGNQVTSGGSSKPSILKELKEGFNWLVSRRGFFLLTLSATFINFFIDMAFTYFVIYVAEGIDASSLIFGAILASFAAGDVIGSLLGGRLNLLRHSGKINVVLYGGVPGICILAMGIIPGAYTAISFIFIAGLSFGISVNLWLTTAHNIVPPNMRGRYFALDGVLSSLSPIAIAAGAIAIEFLGILNDFILAGILILVFTLVFALMKSLWNLDGRGRNTVKQENDIHSD